MKPMQSFLLFFFILDYGYNECKGEDDLGAFLGTISPELWDDGRPIDRSIYNDWIFKFNPRFVKMSNILNKIYSFLNLYEEKWGYNFSEIKCWILKNADIKAVQSSWKKVEDMYRIYNYAD